GGAPGPGAARSGVVVLGVAQVPLEQDVLPLGVAHHPLAVAAELGVVRRQQHEPGHHPSPELLDELAVAEVGLDLPVRRHRPEVDDPGVGAGRLGGGRGVGHGLRAYPPCRPITAVICRSRPSRSTVISTSSPGSCSRMISPRRSLEVIASPSTATITSPTRMPASSAPLPGTTSTTKAPSSDSMPSRSRTASSTDSTGTVLTPSRGVSGVTSPVPSRRSSMMGMAESIEMAKPTFWLSSMIAVLMPTTSPAESTSGPPELPWLMAASVWMRSVRVP